MVDLNWFERVLPGLLSTDYPLAPHERLIVLSADTDRIQHYVFESDKLPEIRGASRLLTELNEQEMPGIIQHILARSGLPDDQAYGYSKQCVLYAQGGGLLALLPPDPDLVKNICRELEALYPRVTGTATVTTVCREFTAKQIFDGFGPAPGDLANTPTARIVHSQLDKYFEVEDDETLSAHHMERRKHFGEIMLLMSTMLHRAKQQRAIAPFIERLPHAQLCKSCQTRPADGFIHEDPDQPICSICRQKNMLGSKEERRHWLRELDDLLAEYQYPAVDQAEYPRDMIQIDNGNPIAFIYADGDGVGGLLHRLATPYQYRTFSATLQEITRQAVVSALMDNELFPYTVDDELTGRPRLVHPWEIIMIGGDDVLMIVPSRVALDFAADLAQRFRILAEPALSPLVREPVQMSVGIAIGKPKRPVRVLRDTAYRALKQAKKRALDVHEPCIDYHNIIKEDIAGDNLDTWRDEMHALNTNTALTGRPYTLSEISVLCRNVTALQQANFPSGQLYQISDELRQGFERGMLYYAYQRARLKHHQLQILDEIENYWVIDPANGRWPWVKRADDHARYPFFTPLIDIADLVTALPKPPRGEYE